MPPALWQPPCFPWLGSMEDLNGDKYMDRLNPLFTATAIGGRNGHTESNDGLVKADLSVPKAMGGPGKPGTATPRAPFRRRLRGLLRRLARFRRQEERGVEGQGNMRGNHRRARGRWFWDRGEDARRG